VSDVVQGSCEGFNGTIFAYGQTASGKTFSMMGTEDSPGIIPTSLSGVFSYIAASADEFLLRVQVQRSSAAK
jgi:hypothetical protein